MTDIIQQELDLGQWRKPGREGRRSRRRIRLMLNRMAKRFRRGEIPVEFDDRTCTSFGLFARIEQFKQIIGLRPLVEQVVSLRKGHNSRWGAAEMIDYMLDNLVLGQSRFEHMEALRRDPGYRKVKEVDSMPGEKRYRDLMGMATEETLLELVDVNEYLLRGMAAWEGPREVWLDYDDTVLTLHGKQEGGQVGYNPRLRGRPSLALRVAQVSEWRAVLWVEMEGGATRLNSNFLSTHRVCEAGLRNMGLVLAGVRGDRSLYDEKNCEAFEADQTLYLFKAQMHNRLRRYILTRIEPEHWQPVSSHFDAADIRYLPGSWSKERRFVIVRERVEKESGQELLPLEECYYYQAIVTNDEDSSPEAVWHNYNRRCTVENQIEELKNGFACGQNSQHELTRNRAFMLMKVIAYNLVNWFRRAALPAEMSGARVKTIRRRVLNVAGNVLGEGRKRRIRLAPNPWLQRVEAIIREKLWSMYEWAQFKWLPSQC